LSGLRYLLDKSCPLCGFRMMGDIRGLPAGFRAPISRRVAAGIAGQRPRRQDWGLQHF